MRTRTRLPVLLAALVTAGSSALALAPGAHAADTPTIRQLLLKCDNGSDVCIFHPEGSAEIFTGEAHQVGSKTYNCTPDTQRSAVAWSDTTGETNSVGISMSAEYGFSEVFKVTVEASYEHSWSSSHTESETTYIEVRPGQVGWVTRETRMQRIDGTYELHFPDPYYGHYYWYAPFEATGPVPDAPGTKTQHTRPMTDRERTEHCG